MNLLTILIIIFLALWVLGISFAATLGGLIHILLVVAVIIIIIRLIKGEPIF